MSFSVNFQPKDRKTATLSEKAMAKITFKKSYLRKIMWENLSGIVRF